MWRESLSRDPFRAVLAEESGSLVLLLGAAEERQVIRQDYQCTRAQLLILTIASASSAALGVMVASWARMCAKW